MKEERERKATEKVVRRPRKKSESADGGGTRKQEKAFLPPWQKKRVGGIETHFRCLPPAPSHCISSRKPDISETIDDMLGKVRPEIESFIVLIQLA